jgi:hypothetical protein
MENNLSVSGSLYNGFLYRTTDIVRIDEVGVNRYLRGKVNKTRNSLNFYSLKGGNKRIGYVKLDKNVIGYPDLVIM